MEYGYFSEDYKEYIITRPDTPRPWVNYLFNDQYHAIVSQTGGGFSYCKDARFNRIHRYERHITDRPGRYLFLHDEHSQQAWSANWQPMRLPYQLYRCHHGLGYTKIVSKYYDILTSLTYLVTLDDPVEIMIVNMKNCGNKNRKLTVFPFIDIVSGDLMIDIAYPNISCLYNRAFFDDNLNAILAFKQPFPQRPVETFTFFASSELVTGYDCHREKFIGHYGTLQSPEILMKGQCLNTTVCGEDMIGVLQHRLTLKPSQEKTFVVVTGFVDNELFRLNETEIIRGKKVSQEKRNNLIRSFLDKYLSVKAGYEELAKIKKLWLQRLEQFFIETPDTNINTMINIWGRYQLFGIFNWRGTSIYHGIDSGSGYRDTAQDILGMVIFDSKVARKRLEQLLCYQYKSGHAVSGFSQKEGAWENESEQFVTGKADVAVWLPFSVISYIKETGDFDFHQKIYPFYNGGKASVYEHIIRAARYLSQKVGNHGLPLIGKADWNDAYDQLGIKGNGESVWLAMALCRALKQIQELAEYLGDNEIAAEMDSLYNLMSKKINSIGWDGNWYIAAINDNGLKIGSDKNNQGKIPLNSQTWAILGGVANEQRAHNILKIIDEQLDTPYGPHLFTPTYTEFNPGIGRVTAFAPGTKENAAVFSHACAFKIVADCMMKRGNKAYETLAKILPMHSLKAIDPDHYKAEPYVFAEYVIGPKHPTDFGRGEFTWNTGTTPWMFVAVTAWILGVRPTFVGLEIDPCLPEQWTHCYMKRPFRGAIYNISIENPNHVQSGVKKIIVDEKEIHGRVIKSFSDGKVHKVKVIMGH